MEFILVNVWLVLWNIARTVVNDSFILWSICSPACSWTLCRLARHSDNCCILRAPSYVLRRTGIVVYYNNGFIIATIIAIAIITIIYKDEQPFRSPLLVLNCCRRCSGFRMICSIVKSIHVVLVITLRRLKNESVCDLSARGSTVICDSGVSAFASGIRNCDDCRPRYTLWLNDYRRYRYTACARNGQLLFLWFRGCREHSPILIYSSVVKTMTFIPNNFVQKFDSLRCFLETCRYSCRKYLCDDVFSFDLSVSDAFYFQNFFRVSL